MAKRSGEAIYNTNLAAEYLMMSLLSRAGKDAYLSLGNKKGVDIVVTKGKDAFLTIEVKGVNKKNDWLICNAGKLPVASNLFYSLIYFKGEINNINVPANFWLIPSEKIFNAGDYKIAGNEKTVYISISCILKNYEEYKNTFKWLDEYLAELAEIKE